MTTPNDPQNPESNNSGNHNSGEYNFGADNSANNSSESYGSHRYQGSDYSNTDQTQSFDSSAQSPYDQTAYQQNQPFGAPQSAQQNQANQAQPNQQFGGYGQDQQFAGYGQAQNQPSFGGYQGYPAAPNTTGAQKDSFFSALFDLSFTKYATPSVAKTLYVILMVITGLYVLFGIIGCLSLLAQGGGEAVLGVVIGVPGVLLLGLTMLALFRVSLEVSVAQIRTSQAVMSMDSRDAQDTQTQTQTSTNYPYSGQNNQSF